MTTHTAFDAPMAFRQVLHRSLDGNKPFNTGFSGLRDLMQTKAERTPASTPKPAESNHPNSLFDPPDVATASPTRRSRARGREIRTMMAVTGRSAPWCRAYLRVCASGNGGLIGMLFTHQISVSRAASMLG